MYPHLQTIRVSFLHSSRTIAAFGFCLVMVMGLVGCGPNIEKTTELKEAWNTANRPALLLADFRFESRFDQLPMGDHNISALGLDTLWSDDYWPDYRGGISYRWNDLRSSQEMRSKYPVLSRDEVLQLTPAELRNLSPSEKFDILQGRYDFPLTKRERDRTGILVREHIPSWEGLCHAWATATLAYINPSPVVLQNDDHVDVPFGSSDVKALLTAHMHYSRSPRTYFLGQRCNKNFAALRNELDPEAYEQAIRSSECRDTNAGSFHMVLANQIALRDQGFIADVTTDYEVWNQAVVGYSTRVIDRHPGAGPTAAPGTVEEVLVETEMRYISEIGQTWDRLSLPNYAVDSRTYRYTLELDRRGEIIGGEWESPIQPDFLWKETTPVFSGMFRGLGQVYESATAH